MEKLTGQCLCGAIAYEIDGPLGPIYNCHCSKCRRWHGSAFRTRASVESKHFKWVRGEERLSKYHSSDTIIKTFCSVCGSNLISIIEDNPEFIGLPIGGLEQDPGNRPIANIYAASKAPWYDICDGLPQYDEWPPGAADTVRGSTS
ncbi:MAG: aldehyde-activating protein [Coxiella sp. (in: Bacteria)]|nr:MAG: aldehyde-activating protein [Coxiella sp. (in: g-proteobacteria)]